MNVLRDGTIIYFKELYPSSKVYRTLDSYSMDYMKSRFETLYMAALYISRVDNMGGIHLLTVCRTNNQFLTILLSSFQKFCIIMRLELYD
jgi:hypothetical protein